MHAVDRLTDRTCKVVDHRSPREVIFGVQMRYTSCFYSGVGSAAAVSMEGGLFILRCRNNTGGGE